MIKNLEDFGIVEGVEYNITFERLEKNSDCKCGIVKTIRGVIMNYDTWQFSVKAKDGHYIILRKNVLEMFPIHERIVTVSNEGISIRGGLITIHGVDAHNGIGQTH